MTIHDIQFRKLLFSVLALMCMVWAYSQQSIRSADISFEFISKGVDGSIGDFESASQVDLQQIDLSSFQGSVAVETLRTGNFIRDWSLKSSKYFDEDRHPRIRFKSSRVVQKDYGFEVLGQLQIKGITREVKMEFRPKGSQLIGTTSLFSSDFGIEIKKKREENLVKVKLVLELE